MAFVVTGLRISTNTCGQMAQSSIQLLGIFSCSTSAKYEYLVHSLNKSVLSPGSPDLAPKGSDRGNDSFTTPLNLDDGF